MPTRRPSVNRGQGKYTYDTLEERVIDAFLFDCGYRPLMLTPYAIVVVELVYPPRRHTTPSSEHFNNSHS
jgi:hypothetical protein